MISPGVETALSHPEVFVIGSAGFALRFLLGWSSGDIRASSRNQSTRHLIVVETYPQKWGTIKSHLTSELTSVCACMCVYQLPQSFSILFSRRVSHWTWNLPIQLGWLAGKPYGSSLSPPPSSRLQLSENQLYSQCLLCHQFREYWAYLTDPCCLMDCRPSIVLNHLLDFTHLGLKYFLSNMSNMSHRKDCPVLRLIKQ